MHAQQRIDLTIGTTSIARPRTHATVGVLTAVVTTDNGDVTGCVVPIAL
jgi:hypothetical protein